MIIFWSVTFRLLRVIKIKTNHSVVRNFKIIASCNFFQKMIIFWSVTYRPWRVIKIKTDHSVVRNLQVVTFHEDAISCAANSMHIYRYICTLRIGIKCSPIIVFDHFPSYGPLQAAYEIIYIYIYINFLRIENKVC